ncbi:MAG: pyridoxal-phosphate dependent enzyme [Lachnospiraceae bacterium]|nr:pyridoxal-phosphate dependent enzyme [Lachnospiraceae bacterium]
MVYNNILEAIGHTPIVRLHKVTDPSMAEVLVKYEGLNIGGSIKTRTAYNMLKKAEQEGLIHESGICVISDEEALNTARRLMREEGIMCGISSGSNVAAALKMAKILGPGNTVVTILPDTGDRYFSTVLFEDDASPESGA